MIEHNHMTLFSPNGNSHANDVINISVSVPLEGEIYETDA